jgi:hypothetical protein
VSGPAAAATTGLARAGAAERGATSAVEPGATPTAESPGPAPAPGPSPSVARAGASEPQERRHAPVPPPAPVAPRASAGPSDPAATTAASGAPPAPTSAADDPSAGDPLLADLVARDSSDEPVPVSFARIADQLPSGLCSVPLERLVAELERPGQILVPRRLALAQLAKGMVRAPWDLVAGQLPAHLLLMTSQEVAGRLPDGQVLLPIDEIVRQLPPALFIRGGPPADISGIEGFPEPFQPMADAAAPPTSAPDSAEGGPVSDPAPAPVAVTAAPSPMPRTEADAAGGPASLDGAAPDAAAVEAPAAELDGARRETGGRRHPPSPHGAAVAAARVLAAAVAPLGAFEVAVRAADGTELLSMSRAGMEAEVATATAVVLPLLADRRAPWTVDQVTVRARRAVVVLTALGSFGAGGPALAAAVRPGGPLALLELRAREAAAAHSGDLAPGTGADAAADDGEEPELLDVEASTRVHEVASSLGALGTVSAHALRDVEAGRAIYLFLPAGSDARAVGAFADQVATALQGPAAAALDARTVVLRSGPRRMIIGVPAAGSACRDTIVAAGETARPGLAFRQVEQAARTLAL